MNKQNTSWVVCLLTFIYYVETMGLRRSENMAVFVLKNKRKKTGLHVQQHEELLWLC